MLLPLRNSAEYNLNGLFSKFTIYRNRMNQVTDGLLKLKIPPEQDLCS